MSSYGILAPLSLPLGLGLLRLSTEGRPAEAEAVSVIHYALDHGIRILDTADVYSLGADDLHYGERLLRRAIDSWKGPALEVKVITKAGLSRPKGRWIPNGRPEHLRKTVEASLQALGVEQIFLLLLHANDPRTPFEDTLGALADLRKEGKIAHLGLCNTSIAEVRQAERHFPVMAIQNELSVMDRNSAKDGLVALARKMGIPFLAHRPLGGHAKTGSLLKNRAMAPLASKYRVTPHEAALAVLWDAGAPVIPLVGATKIESLKSCLSARDIRMDEADRTALGAKITFEPTPEALKATEPPAVPKGLRTLKMGEGPGEEPEVVVVMGIQGAGKSELVRRYVDAGYARLNRDLLGGTLDDLVPRMADLLAAGETRIVLDNTYGTRVSRYPVIRTAHAHQVPVRCLFLATPVEEAYTNVVCRILERYGRLLGPDEMKELSKQDPNLPPPQAMIRWASSFEPPALDEGFSVVEEIPFVRREETKFTGKGLLLDVDGTLRTTRSGEIYPRDAADVVMLPGRREALQSWIDRGYRLFFVSNQSGVASGNVSVQAAEAAFAKTIELLDLPVEEVAYCPHPAFPVGCFCRKPLPGLGIYLKHRHQLAVEHLVMVGDMESDQQFAKAIGAKYYHTDEFFGAGVED